MKNINKISSFFFFVATAYFFLGYSSGQASNYARAPLAGGGFESTCNVCHSSFGSNPITTGLVLTGTPTSYTAGQTYPLTLTVTNTTSGIVQAGFQIVATNGSNGTQIGTFSAPTGTQLAGSGRLIQQYPQGLNSSGSASWSFDWTAPSSGSPANVVFYYVAVAGNNGGGSGGDYVHSGNSNLIALGVELTAFNAVVQKNNQVKIDWQTAAEKDNSHFVVERKTSNLPFFQDISTIKGQGTSTTTQKYSYIDDASDVQEVAYYRLRQEDFNGKVSYSKVISVALKTDFKVKIYPSIVKNGDVLTVETSDLSDKTTTIDVVNMAGQTVEIEKKVAFTEGVQFPVSNLLAGRYIIRIRQNGQQNFASFVVQ